MDTEFLMSSKQIVFQNFLVALSQIACQTNKRQTFGTNTHIVTLSEKWRQCMCISRRSTISSLVTICLCKTIPIVQERKSQSSKKKMVENNGIELTEDEAELYDRQIRLWGLDSQKRIRAARILIAGLNGLGAEVAKNIILSGVKSVTLLDDKLVSETDFCSQFLVSHESVGQNRAEASLFRAQALNPMVEIIVDKENVREKPDEYFHRFDVVVLIEVPLPILVRIDNICRLKGIKFFCGDVWGMNGYTFTDLQEHEFAE